MRGQRAAGDPLAVDRDQDGRVPLRPVHAGLPIGGRAARATGQAVPARCGDYRAGAPREAHGASAGLHAGH